jgi:putative ABC transport system permease protein
MMRALVRLLVHPRDREHVIGDLDDGFAARVERDGLPSAKRWYRRQIISSLTPLVGHRLALLAEDLATLSKQDGRMDALLLDTRQAFRSFRHARGFTIISVLSLAIGIAACTTIFTALQALVLRALPFSDVDRLVKLTELTATCNSCSTSAGDYVTVHRDAKAFAAVATVRGWTGTLSLSDGAERIGGARVTPGFFSLLGVRPTLGRTFDDDSLATTTPLVTLISDKLWRKRFGANPGVVGSTITLNSVAVTVIGVLPPNFGIGGGGDIWLPLVFSPAQQRDYASHGWTLFARLAPGVTMQQANDELLRLSDRVNRDYPEQSFGMHLAAQPFDVAMIGTLRQFFMPLLGGVAFVLLIVCANIANLSLARGTSRAREIAMRAALGASRGRIVRQLFIESGAIALVGAVGGLAIASVMIPILKTTIPSHFMGSIRGWDSLAMDWRVVLFAIGVSALSAILFGTLPAIRASRTNLATAFADAARGSTSAHGGALRSGLVVVELALALTLLTGSGLMMRSLVKLMNTDTGYEGEHSITMDLQVPARKHVGAVAVAEFERQLREAVGALPGVTAIGGTWNLPMSGQRNMTFYDLADRPPTPAAQQPVANDGWVSPGYFAAVGMRVVRGRDFTVRDDTASPPAAIVSKSFAEKAWPTKDPIGQIIISSGRRYEVVGVVTDVRADGVDAKTLPTIYRAITQTGGLLTGLVVRADGDVQGVTTGIRRALRKIDPDAAIDNVQTMPQVLDAYLTPWRLLGGLLGAFAAIALVIAAIGIYGVMSYAVTQRTQEIGIRMALGADRRAVLRMILRQSAVMVLAGVAIGGVGALGTGRVLAFQLYEVSARDPLVLATVALILILVSLAAVLVPARRATAVDPIIALRAP